MEQADICSTCVPPAASKTRGGGTPTIPCPVSKIGACSTWATKKQHTPHLRATAPLRPCVGFSRAGWKPAPPGQRRRRWSALREHHVVLFSVPVQFALWTKKPHPLDVGCGSRIKRRVLTPAAGHTGRQSRPGKREFSEAFRPRLLDLHKESKLVKLHLRGVTPKPGSPDCSGVSGV